MKQRLLLILAVASAALTAVIVLRQPAPAPVRIELPAAVVQAEAPVPAPAPAECCTSAASPPPVVAAPARTLDPRAIDAFAAWAGAYAAAPAELRPAMLAEGTRLATARALAFGELIRTDPQKALAALLP